MTWNPTGVAVIAAYTITAAFVHDSMFVIASDPVIMYVVIVATDANAALMIASSAVDVNVVIFYSIVLHCRAA